MTDNEATEPSAEGLKEIGWRQGSIISVDLARKLIASGDIAGASEEASVLIVVSHDCDVTNSSFVNEPIVEILAAHHTDQLDGSLTTGKNPRRLQFEIEAGGERQLLEAAACERFIIPRNRLVGYAPDKERLCDRLVVRQISDWLSRRYVRAALPDNLNRRTQPAQNKIRKALAAGGDSITSLFLGLDTQEEISELQPYRLILIATMREEEFKIPGKRAQAQRTIDQIEAKLAACAGIEMIESRLVGEGDVSIDDLSHLIRWDSYDYLSFREDDESTSHS